MDPTNLALMTAAQHGGGVVYSLDIQTLLIITGLAFLPGLILLMSAFTRIIVILSMSGRRSALRRRRPTWC